MRGYTLRGLARYTGIPYATITSYARGVIELTPPQRAALAAALQLTEDALAHLMGGDHARDHAQT
jgi:transcriptional regulator with XRE-family HTH domain